MLKTTLILSLLCVIASGQSDRGTITGTISDPAGAVVPGAPIEVHNVATGATFQAGSSQTGNYTLAQLPTGTYEMELTVPGFKHYVRKNIEVPVAQTIRLDVVLEVGATSDSVTVTDAAPLLKTESGELSHNVATERLNSLPVLSIGSTTAGLRNVYSSIQLIPGATYNADTTVRINGMIGNSQSVLIEGQDASNRIFSQNQSTIQPSVDSVQEVAIQTSNFAAEFGQAGGGVFNLTMKYGTNQYHGTAYDYFVNEFLNAGQSWTDDGSGNLLRNRQRRNDWGFTFGGPIRVPRVYNGRDKTFFLFNFERYQEDNLITNKIVTVPTLQYRLGNFAAARLTRNLCPAATPNCDPLGRPITEGTIYDPGTDRLVGGQRVRDPYAGNLISPTFFDPVSTKIQNFIPTPNLSSSVISNYRPVYVNPNRSAVPSVKLDQNLSSAAKVSGFWSRITNNSPSADGLPFPITSSVPRDYSSDTYRINYDHTLTPTLLGHLGVGMLRTIIFQPGADYDPVSQLGLRGTYTNMFPNITGLSNAQGGMSATMGSGNQNHLDSTKPTANATLTWVKNNHTYKFGGQLIVEGFTNFTRTYANGWLAFAVTETGLPSTLGQSLTNSNIGFPYASFLLGAVDNGRISLPSKTRLGSHALSGFAQDTWKVTRKLTLDYGLRYDFQTYLKEQYGRIPDFAPNVPNPAAGGRLGDLAFEGYGPNRCQCQIAHSYPFAFGPRVGVAYQIDSKTVLRVGAGVAYDRTDNNNNLSYSLGSLQIYSATSFGDPVYSLRQGLPFTLTWPNFSHGQFPAPGNLNAPNVAMDANAGRPARTVQWSVGLQRQVMKDLVVEAAYVGNRGAWWNATGLIDVNALSPDRLRSFGLDINNPDDRRLLATPITQAYAAQRGFATTPYPGFPTGSSVAQTLRAFPQFGTISYRYSPLGKTWYDSLQMKATKRMSHGLDFTTAFTYQKELTLGAENEFAAFGAVNPQINDVFNRNTNKYLSGFSQPFSLVIAGNYTTPRRGPGIVKHVVADWAIGAVMTYASGLPIRVPSANNQLASSLFRSTYANRVPGQPLFLQDLNCHCFDPNKTLALNPAAWVDPPQGQYGTSTAYYNDFRAERRPRESMSIARNYRLGPGDRSLKLQVRAEFTNIFNRSSMVDPVATNASAAPTCFTPGTSSASCSGNWQNRTGGFGWINTSTVASPPRQGQLIARFTF